MGKSPLALAGEDPEKRAARLESLFQHLCVPVVVADADGVIRMMNPCAAAYLEGAPTDFVGRPVQELIPERGGAYLERIRRILKHGESEQFEDPIRLPSGDKWFSSAWKPARDENGDLIGVLATACDITRQKQIEADLRLTEGHLRALLESATDFAVYRLVQDQDRPGRLRVAVVSPSIKKILGISDPTNFESWFANIHPDDVGRIVEANLRAFETHRFNEQYRTYHETAGEWRWIHALSTGGADDADVNRYVNGIIIDITDKKRTEEALQAHQEHIRALTETVSDFCVYRLARTGDDQRRLEVVFVSPSAGEMLGVADPTRFEAWYENVHPEDLERVGQADVKALETGSFDEQIRIYDRNGGNWRWIHAVSSTSTGAEGSGGYVNGIMIDITERKLNEEKLIEYEQRLKKRARHLEEANTALRVIIRERKRDRAEPEERIASNIEASILPFIDKLKNKKLDAETRGYLDIIDSNLKSIGSSFSARLSSGHARLTPTEIQVANFVKLGYTTKQISERMNVSVKTTDVHRFKIRKKLGLHSKKINLRTYLLSHLDD